MGKFRRKPLIVEAMQYTGTVESISAICRWANDPRQAPEDPWVSYITTSLESAPRDVLVSTERGDLEMLTGDWVVKAYDGSFNLVPDALFRINYENLVPTPT